MKQLIDTCLENIQEDTTDVPILELIFFRKHSLILLTSYCCCLKLQINSKQVCGGVAYCLLILVNKDLDFFFFF